MNFFPSCSLKREHGVEALINLFYNRNLRTGMNDRISKAMYSNVNEKIERVSEIVYFVLVKLNIFAVILPPLITTMVNYYISGLGDESFYLATPVM